ncbi:uncharacterized protein LOC129719854 isoform X2 [Wyeomyia smithii]|uniref:uncharacterized protein LOC129719854 isoform X2 n=1 Tax=Wyeomyia smithii TaxID=174621 RepID=UPI00246800FE|nr:uncharacterized protein LOC129719854 isoform X2 [Wyeomyia smithii]
MAYRETTRWYLKRLHQTEFKIVNIGASTDISRSLSSAIRLNRHSFQHVSKRHCIISCVDGVATLTDETSTSGTFINNVKLSRETPGSVVLSAGDRIGIGSPCFNDPSFYANNNHVLLYQVCKDRNRVITDGDVDTILSSDEETHATSNLQKVPQTKSPKSVDINDENYRILGNIDLSSDVDDDDVIYLNCEDNVTRLDRAILEETEKRAKDLEKLIGDRETKQHTQVEKETEQKQMIVAHDTEEAQGKCNEKRQRNEKEDVKRILDKKSEEKTQNVSAQKNDLEELTRKHEKNEQIDRDHQNPNELRKEILHEKTHKMLPEQKQKTKENDSKDTNKSDESSGDRLRSLTHNTRPEEYEIKSTGEKIRHGKDRERKFKHTSKHHDTKSNSHSSKSEDNTSLKKDKNRHKNSTNKDKKDSKNDNSYKYVSDENNASRETKADYCLDQIEELFKDSLSIPSEAMSVISVHDSESDDDKEFSEQKFSQSYYRQIKQEALEIDLPDENDSDNQNEVLVTNQLVVDAPLFNDSETIYISEDDDDEETLEDSKRWFKKLSQKSSPLRNKSQLREAQLDKPHTLEQSLSSFQHLSYPSTSRNSDSSTLKFTTVKPNCKPQAISTNIPNVDQALKTFEADPNKRKNESHNLNSPVRARQKRSLPDEVPKASEQRPTIKERIIEGDFDLDDSFFSEILIECEKEQHENISMDCRPSDPKKQKIQENERTQLTLSNSDCITAKSSSIKPISPDVPRPRLNEKNTNSASNAWVKRKVPMVEPHHIQKRRQSLCNGVLSKKTLKPDQQSPIRKSIKSNEALKEKLKAIKSTKSQPSGETAKDNSSRPITIPKCKFTPTNRGAFLVHETPRPSKPLMRANSLPNNNNDDDFVCTQSTSIEKFPELDKMIDVSLTRAPKLTFNNVAKVSSVTNNAPVFKIPKQRPPPTAKVVLTDSESFRSILATIELPKENEIPQVGISANAFTSSITSATNGLKSILKTNNLTYSNGQSQSKRTKRVNWCHILTDTRVFEIEEGNELCVQTKEYKESYDCRKMTQVSLSEIILEITSWNPSWFDNPAEAKVCEGMLLPMVEEYQNFEEYTKIVMPILKMELFHDILVQYGEMRKTCQKPLQMKLNQIRAQSKIFVLNCSVENSSHQSVNNKDYVLIIFRDKITCEEIRVPAVVSTRRQLIQYSAENGVKFYHCTLETAKNKLSQRIRDGFGESFQIVSLTQINMHLRQFQTLAALESSPLLENILCPRSNFFTCRISMNDRRAYKGKESLNVQQGDILLSVFGQCLDMKQPHIMLIQGPPGTGKSRLISNLVMQLHRSFPSHKKLKILVCTQSNTAIDVIVLKLIKLFRLLNKEEQGNILRTGTANKINHECRMVFLDDLARRRVNGDIKRRKLREENPTLETYFIEKETLERRLKYLAIKATNEGNSRQQDEINRLQEQLNRIKQILPNDVDAIDVQESDRRSLEISAKKDFVARADIICTTLGSCGALMEYSKSLKFDVCIIDEATQCTEIASFTPLQYNVRKLILVGDPKQLPPLVFGKEAADAGLKNSLFSRIENSFIGTDLEGVKMLTTQYRMHPEILKWPNEYFYEGKLSSDMQSTKCDEFPFRPYTVFSLEYQQNQTQSEHQIYNDDEIQFVLSLLSEIMKFCERHTSIAIITPYTRHKREIEKYLHTKRITQVSVLSIDSVQGQEYDVVIISLARSTGMGFLDSPQRLNVALTRARKCLILCGNFADLQGTNMWSALLKDAEDRKLLFNIEDNDEYSDVNTFVEKVMRSLRKSPALC